jgi:hypothetical protein
MMSLIWAATVHYSSVIMHKCLTKRKICWWTCTHISMLSYWLFRWIIRNCWLFKWKYYLFFLRNERFRLCYLLLNIRSLDLNRRHLLCLLLFNYWLFFYHNLYCRWLNNNCHFFGSPFPSTYFLNIFEVWIKALLHFPSLLFIFIIIWILLLPLLIVTLLRVHVSLILKLIVIGPSPIVHSLCSGPGRCVRLDEVFFNLSHYIFQPS